MRVVLLLLLLIPQLALARIYMCTDPATGKTLFTDQACDSGDTPEEIRVETTNVTAGRLAPGKNEREPPPPKTWKSDRDQRKTGRDYASRREELYQNSATAQQRD